MIQGRFLFRELLRSAQQATIFVICITLSLTTLTALAGFSDSVNHALKNDAQRLHGGDIIVRTYDPISVGLEQAVADLVQKDQVVRTHFWEMLSVVQTTDQKRSVLAGLKVVEKGYPFYGKVQLQSGRSFDLVLSAGKTVVSQTLLDRLGLKIGDPIKIGFTTLAIADVVVAEPDGSGNIFSFGPRVFVARADLEALGLIKKGSRIRRTLLLKVPDAEAIETLAEALRQVALGDQERVDTYWTARSRVKRFLDNFIFFLKLVGVFILVIAGVGIQGTLSALLNAKKFTIAVMKAVGATNRFISVHFMLLVLTLGVIGTVLGMLSGYAIQYALVRMLGTLLPANTPIALSWTGILESLVLGLGVVGLFAFLPLSRLREMRPVMIFRRDFAAVPQRWPYYMSAILGAAFFSALVLWHMQNLRIGFTFIFAIVMLVLVSALFTQLLISLLSRFSPGPLTVRQAVKGLYRKGNATRSVVITLTASLSVIFSLYLIEQNLNATFVQSFPSDAPNLFFVDIQPAQKTAFAKAVGRKTTFYPVIRARVVAVNGQKVNRRQEQQKRRDNLGRMFNLTYRERLLADERIVEGDQLFRSDWQGVQVSVMDTVQDMHPMAVGDTIRFKIQGVPLDARISSVRTRSKGSFNPFFYFVFQTEVLMDAPQTLFTAFHVPKSRIGAVQNKVVAAFPNVSVIDLSHMIRVFARLMTRLSAIVRLFSLMSIGAGILILISAVLATRAERITEAVYLKILGAPKHFIVKVFALENILVALISSGLALCLAQAGTWAMCRFVFEIGYDPKGWACLAMTGGTVLLILTVGMVASRSILAKKPVSYLREQQNT